MRTTLILVALFALPAYATEPAIDKPRIAIIIDDIGDRFEAGRHAVELPGAVACAFLPHTPHAAELARRAHAAGKEVLLHLPLQSLAGKALGPGAITLDTTEREFHRILADNLGAIPHVVGVNNHMGSLLTRHPGHMTWLMEGIAARGDLYFVDSYTHADSVALAMARERGIAAARRDVFLDNIPAREEIRAEFERLVEIAKAEGSAIGIGHPYEETLAYLAETLPLLDAAGIELVPVAELLERDATIVATDQESAPHSDATAGQVEEAHASTRTRPRSPR